MKISGVFFISRLHRDDLCLLTFDESAVFNNGKKREGGAMRQASKPVPVKELERCNIPHPSNGNDVSASSPYS